MYILNFIRGFFMAVADSVPGVSGGTIAFILGFYDKFIGALNTLLSKEDSRHKKEALIFLGKLGIGWIAGFILSVLFLSSIFESHIYQISSVFTGFIIFSIPIILKEEQRTIRDHFPHLIWTVVGALLVVGITYFNPIATGNGFQISFNDMSIGIFIYVFIAGLIAISAMVLPGISGSTLLLIFGLYTSIITAIKELLTLNFSVLPILITFGLGILVGIGTTIKVIRYLLIHARSQLIYFILGLMLASVYAVFMGPTTLDVPQPAMNLNTFSFIYFLIGGVFILALEQLRSLLEKKQGGAN